jgi:hypothetical protein
MKYKIINFLYSSILEKPSDVTVGCLTLFLTGDWWRRHFITLPAWNVEMPKFRKRPHFTSYTVFRCYVVFFLINHEIEMAKRFWKQHFTFRHCLTVLIEQSVGLQFERKKSLNAPRLRTIHHPSTSARLIGAIIALMCTGSGLVVPHSSHKREFAGLIQAGDTKISLIGAIIALGCTGSGLVVPHSSHKQEFAGSIPAGCTKKLFSPHCCCHLTNCMTSDDVWLHLSYTPKSASHKTLQQRQQLNPPKWRKKTALPLKSTGEEWKEETK